MSYIVHEKMPMRCFECKEISSSTIDGYSCGIAHRSLASEHGINIKRPDWCPLIEIPAPHGDLVDLSDVVHPNDSMRRMTIDEQLRRTCEGWSADRKQYVVIKAEGEA